MNIRKFVNYKAMFAVLDALVTADLPQMELYCEIGRLVSGRPEKGAAVAAAEYLCSAYPDASGFSPRNLRRMREFYRIYENSPEVLAEAMTISWTQNVVILEAELTLQEQAWYIRAVGYFGWSKLELQRKIGAKAHMEIALDSTDEAYYTKERTANMESVTSAEAPIELLPQYFQKFNTPIRYARCDGKSKIGELILHQVHRYQFRRMRRSGLSPGSPQVTGDDIDYPSDVADPWHARDLESAWPDVEVYLIITYRREWYADQYKRVS